MSTEHVSTRVNSAKLPNFRGQAVRLTCRPLNKAGDILIVEASDGGQVNVVLVGDFKAMDIDMKSYIEVIGLVSDESTIKVMSIINLGPDLDMKIVNDTIELIHDPRFFTRMFA